MIEFYALLTTILTITLGILYILTVSKLGKQKTSLSKEEFDQQLLLKTNLIREEKQQQVELLKNELKEKFQEKEKSLREELTAKNEIVLEKLKLTYQTEIKQEETQMRQRILELQEKVDEKESLLEAKLEKIDEEKNRIELLKEELKNIKQDLINKKEFLEKQEEDKNREFKEKLEKLAQISYTEARELILTKAKQEMGLELLNWQQKMLEDAEENANSKAREIVALAVQRCSSEVANEFTITTIKLANDDDKGKIIGKAGRNIQWLEKTLGVELVIDDTPEVITISGFSSIRRHIAKRTLERLLEDGRIHPASIEDMYEKSKAEIAQEIAEAGQWAVNELGIYDFPAKLIRIIGRLKFRTSYGQNQLKHSVEMAKLAALLAKEMNQKFSTKQNPIDVDICVKGALLHDIGKAVDEETQPHGNHVDLGEKICDSFGLDWRIRKCVSSHHDESYYDPEHGFCIEAAIVDACDNISGGRMGARKETAEAYFQRMEALEKVGETTPGVHKAWIMRGSRELWVFFDTEKTNPLQMHEATREIAKRIQTEVRYPGEIKVVGIWEDKLVEYAS
jgi:ribonuclease Y